MIGVEALTRKVVVTTAVISMFRCAPGTDIAMGATKEQRRVDAAGVTRAMYNIGYRTSTTSSEQAAKNFLRAKNTALALDNVEGDLSVDHVQHVGGGSHIHLTQTYKGIPVYQGEVLLSMNTSDEIGMVVNNYKRNINLTLPTTSIGARAAVAAVRNALPGNAKPIGNAVEPVLMVWQDGKGDYHIAYRVRITTENPSGDWEAFVEATSGTVLHLENRFANHTNVTHVQGSGFVYLTDPLSAAHKRYGSPGFSDNSDADSDSLNFYRSQITLDSLTFENGVYTLKGPYCEVTDIESPAGPLFYAVADKDGFDFTRSQQEFEAVNVYYHVSKSYQYIQSLGFSSASLTGIRLDPHGFQGVDNSHYSPNGNWIAWGDGGVDDAEDVDAILHEYGHAIVFNFCPSWGGGESGALGEGYSDYWAASSSRQSKAWQQTDYEYNWVYNWNAHNMFMLGRCVNDTRTYPFGELEIHDAGQIWSSALMSIWTDLGKEVTDKLVLKSLYYLGAAATATDAAQALIQADRDLYGGAHIASLVRQLGAAKRFIKPEDYIPAITHTPLADVSFPRWPATITATVSRNQPIDVVWVEYTLARTSIARTFSLPQRDDSSYSAMFPIAASDLIVGDTISYRIFARSTNDSQVTAVAGEFRFSIVGITTSVTNTEQLSQFALSQNYPNPFNPSTTISFSLSEQSQVTLRVYTLLGQEVATIASGVYPAGLFNAVWDGTNDAHFKAASGTYVYRLVANNLADNREIIQQRKLMLVK